MDYMNFPEGMTKELMTVIDKAAQENDWDSCSELAAAVYKEVTTADPETEFSPEMERLGIETGPRLLAAVDTYLCWREVNPGAVLYEPQPEDLKDPEEEPEAEPAEKRVSAFDVTEISDIALYLVDKIVEKTHLTNRYDVMSHVCNVLEYRFGDGEKLEQNLDRMNLATTKDVLHVIDIYFTMKKLYPDTVFGRKRMYGVWAPALDACLPKQGGKKGLKEVS